jgi:hypothetical protein
MKLRTASRAPIYTKKPTTIKVSIHKVVVFCELSTRSYTCNI